MRKLFGAVLIILSCVLMGVWMAEEKKRRLKNLRELREIFVTLQGEIRYGGTPLREAIELVAETAVGERTEERDRKIQITYIFLKIAKKLEERGHGGFYEIWEKEWLLGAKACALEKKDMERLFRIGKTLGQFDRETQIRCLEGYLEGLSGDIVQEEKTIRERIRLCHWLGALAGIFICILMI